MLKSKAIYLIYIVLLSCTSISKSDKEIVIPKQIESYLNDTSNKIILNKDFIIRDSILDIHVNWDTISGEITYYKDLDITKFTELLKHKFINPNEYQNESPSVRRFYYFMTKYPFTLAHGYVVSPNREDYRLSIEGLYIPKIYVTNSVKKDFHDLCKDADEYYDQDDLYSWWD